MPFLKRRRPQCAFVKMRKRGADLHGEKCAGVRCIWAHAREKCERKIDKVAGGARKEEYGKGCGGKRGESARQKWRSRGKQKLKASGREER